MVFDIRTIVLVLGLMQALQMLVFFFQFKANKNIDGPGWWFLWSAFETLGFIFIFLRTITSLLPVIIIFQDVVLFLGTVFIYIGVLRFFNRKPNYKFISGTVGVFLVLHLFFIFIIDSISARSVIFSAAVAITSFSTAISLVKNKTRAVKLTASLNAAVFILHGSVFTYRGIMILAGTHVNDMFSPTFFNFLPYADAMIVCLPTTISFIIMLNQRLNFEISETKSHFELIFNSSPDASVISRVDDGLIIETNESFAKMTGYQKEEVIGKTVTDLQFWKNPSERSELVRELKANGYCENREFQFQRKGGEIFTGLFSGKIITLKGIPHLLSVTHDISERTKADEILRLKNEELRQSNMEKDKLFSIIAHDLRNPFTGFMGLTEMLAEELPGMTIEEVQRLVTQMRNSAAIKKDIKIANTVPEELKIYSDINVFHTILRNLVSNAVKFTQKMGR